MEKKLSHGCRCLLCLNLIIGFIYFIKGGIFLKALTSFCFVSIGLLSFFSLRGKKQNIKPSLLILFGLISCFIADVVLNFDFIIGAMIFALGHVFYVFAYSVLEKFNSRDIVAIISISVFSFIFLLFFGILHLQDSLTVCICSVYTLIISVMVGKAVGNTFSLKNKTSTLLLIGSILFLISDVALMFYVFKNATEFANTICLITYFPAQCFIALSINTLESHG